MHSRYRSEATFIKQLNIHNGGGIHGYDPGVGERVYLVEKVGVGERVV